MTASLRDADPLTPFPDHALSEVVAQHKAAPKDPTTLWYLIVSQTWHKTSGGQVICKIQHEGIL